MDYCIAVIPITNANRSIDLFDNKCWPLNDGNRKNWGALTFLIMFSELDSPFATTNMECQDDPETYEGAPVGVQIIGRKHEEEQVWAIARMVDAATNDTIWEDEIS